jgi:hypothetical protein
MSTLVELKTEEEWNKYAAEVPETTLQIVYFKAEWAAPVSPPAHLLGFLTSPGLHIIS